MPDPPFTLDRSATPSSKAAQVKPEAVLVKTFPSEPVFVVFNLSLDMIALVIIVSVMPFAGILKVSAFKTNPAPAVYSRPTLDFNV